MNYSKPLTVAAMAAGLVAVGAGVASADDSNAEEIDGQQVQLENDAEAGDDDGDNNGRRRGNRLATVAEVIGIEGDDLREQLQEGATLAEVAEANGVESDELVDSLVANVIERLDAKVEAGDITEDEAAEKLEARTERIENRVNGIEVEDDGDNDGRRGNRDGDADEDADQADDVDADFEAAADGDAEEVDA